MRVSLSNHVTLRNIVAANNGTWGIFTDYSDDLLIENNETFGSQAEHGHLCFQLRRPASDPEQPRP